MAKDAKPSPTSNDLETYIVHVNIPNDQVSTQSLDLESWYKSFLPLTDEGSDQRPRMVHSYRNVVKGFAARLTVEEAKAMEEKDGFVMAQPQRRLALQTTHTPNFLGLSQNLGFWKGANFGKGVIIGVMDTGITADHPSFSDEGVPPPPAKWKGKCELVGMVCNNKLIGARNFVSGDTEPPVDNEGHGTHTSSTAAGNFVKGANALGNANGTASGMAPLAHLAIYKVCGEEDCAEADILAAMDAAVGEGVDVLSLSLGGASVPFFVDATAVGAFGAMQQGIFVSCAAGNSGPLNASLSNEAPWILTVGASTVDRSIKATVSLGNKEFWEGESLFQPQDFEKSMLPLVYPGINGNQDAVWCNKGSLDGIDVKGKVVLCERGSEITRIDKGQKVKDAGGIAMILMNEETDGDSTLAEPHVLPAAHVGFEAGTSIKAYINSTSSPTATIIFKGTVIGVDYAPEVTSFSSRGPSLASPGILKPDIIGPGVNILAAWPVSLENVSFTKATFNVISGTSMSTPHLSGIAALLKSAHPSWSPAAIKSAIMTTANLLNLDNKPITDQTNLPADLLAVGAGHVNPPKANDPGLVYDIQPNDYIPYLCGLGYTDKEVTVLVQDKVKCSMVIDIAEAQLNYPSFAITLGSTTQAYTRTVTNVGDANETYAVTIIPMLGVLVDVRPDVLTFSKVGQKMTYKVTFSRLAIKVKTQYVQGYIKWDSAKHSVRSPISVKLE
ncbi:hypothetical protein LguiB_034619 [Lonicera macranthoides]